MSPKKMLLRVSAAWVFLIVGLLITLVATWLCFRQIEDIRLKEFQIHSGRLQDDIKRVLAANIEVGRGLQGLMQSVPNCDRACFQRYVGKLNLNERFAGFQALTFTRHLTTEQLETFTNSVRQDVSRDRGGYPHFDVRPMTENDDHFVIDYVEPLESNVRAFGFDIGSEAKRRQMVELARDTNQMAVSAPVTLHISDANVLGFLLALPVYRPSAALATVEERRSAFLGVVTVVYRFDRLFNALKEVDNTDNLHLQVADYELPTLPVVNLALTNSDAANRPSQASSVGLHALYSIPIANRVWLLTLTPIANEDNWLQSALPSLVFLIGLFTALLVFMSLRLLAREHRASVSYAAKAIKALEKSEVRLSTIVNTLKDVIWSLDLPVKKLSYISPSCIDIYGLSDAECYSDCDRWFDRVHLDDLPLLVRKLNQLDDKETCSIDLRLTGPDNRERMVAIDMTAQANSKGGKRVNGITRDVTEKRQLNQQIRKLAQIVEQAPVSIAITDLQAKIEYVNQRFCDVSGYKRDELIGANPRVIASGQTARSTYRDLWQTLSTGQAFHGEFLNRKKQGGLYWEQEIIAPLRDEDGNVINYFAVKEDVTELKRFATALTSTNRRLQVMSEVNAALVRAQTTWELLHDVADLLVVVGGFRMAAFVADDTVAGWRCLNVAGLSAANIVTFADAIAKAVPQSVTDCWATKVPVVVEGDELTQQLMQWQCPDVVVRSMLTLPLINANESYGVLLLCSIVEQQFSENEEQLFLRELTGDLCFGLKAIKSAENRKRIESVLRLRQRAIDSSSNGIMIAEVSANSRKVVYVNPALEHMLGYPASELNGKAVEEILNSAPPQSGQADLENALKEGVETVVVLELRDKHAKKLWAKISAAPVADGAGQAGHFVYVFTDISYQKQYENALEYQATHDVLTSLANRALLRDRLERALIQPASGTVVAVLLLDMDRFKNINDTLGHGIGDKFLMQVAERLQTVVGDSDTLARLGGDEFVIVCTSFTNVESVEQFAATIRRELNSTYRVDEHELNVSASIGVAIYPDDGANADELLRNADAAMYAAKAEGGDRPQFFNGEIQIRLTREFDLEMALRHAIVRNELQLYYQPKISLQSGELCGAEALIRWHSKQFGPVSPVEFVPIAERSGLILPIGEWVMREACLQASMWRDVGRKLSVAVNVSARQFQSPDFVNVVERVLAETTLPPHLLRIELTESMLATQPDLAAATLREIKKIGVTIALDDFGTGYSSLSYLRRFSIDELKIDQSFVRDVIEDPDCAAIALSIISLAKSLQLHVVAEGVEKPEQVVFLRRQHCDEAQGYFFSKPLSLTDFIFYLHNKGVQKFDTLEDDKEALLLFTEQVHDFNPLIDSLKNNGYEVLLARDFRGAFNLLAKCGVKAVLIDQRLINQGGLQTGVRVKQIYPNVPRLLLSLDTIETVPLSESERNIFTQLVPVNADVDKVIKAIT